MKQDDTDVTPVNAKDIDSCKQACLKEEKCKAMMFNNLCYLVVGIDPLKDDSKMVS